MMDETACTGGRLISFRPARGPDDSNRRSLQPLESFTAIRLSTGHLDERPAVLRGLDQVGSRHQRQHRDRGEVAAGALGVSGGGVEAGADGRGAQVDLVDQFHGLCQTAARPIFSTSRNSTALRAKESWSTAIARSSSCTANTVAILTAVG